jgi:Cu2+-exporting ATPase
MHSQIRQKAPGSCPICGMTLEPVQNQTARTHHDHMDHGHMGHGGHADHAHHVQDFKKRFWICALLTLPILAMAPMIQQFLGLGESLRFKGDMYLLAALSSLVYFYGGIPFFKGLVSEVRGKLPGMMTLVAIAITAAYLYSMAIVLGLPGMDFFWELATLVDIMLFGHWIEMKSVMGAGGGGADRRRC